MKWRNYQVKDVTTQFDQKATQCSWVGLQDLHQVSSPGCFTSQPPDGPLELRLVRPLTQYNYVLSGNAPGYLDRKNNAAHMWSSCPRAQEKCSMRAISWIYIYIYILCVLRCFHNNTWISIISQHVSAHFNESVSQTGSLSGTSAKIVCWNIWPNILPVFGIMTGADDWRCAFNAFDAITMPLPCCTWWTRLPGRFRFQDQSCPRRPGPGSSRRPRCSPLHARPEMRTNIKPSQSRLRCNAFFTPLELSPVKW